MSTFPDAYRARMRIGRTPSQDLRRAKLQPEPETVHLVAVLSRMLKVTRWLFNAVLHDAT
jgi:hypothetical protein